jgi:hypothetical protein
LTKDKQVNPHTFARLSAHDAAREMCEIVWLVVSKHLYHMTDSGLHIHADMLCDVSRQKA